MAVPLIPLLWLLAFFLIFRFVCWPGGWRSRRGDHARSARQILAERYARGEMSEEEYRTRSSGWRPSGRGREGAIAPPRRAVCG